MLIPKGDYDAPGPCWVPVTDTAGKALKPLIKCRCGWMTGIGLHHVHADGRVTASYYHSAECDPGRGCGFHEFIELADYDGPEWPPHTGEA
jgi:hypothetical protein